MEAPGQGNMLLLVQNITFREGRGRGRLQRQGAGAVLLLSMRTATLFSVSFVISRTQSQPSPQSAVVVARLDSGGMESAMPVCCLLYEQPIKKFKKKSISPESNLATIYR